MPSQSLEHAFDSPWVSGVLVGIAVLMLAVLGRELRKIPAGLLVLMGTAFLDMVGLLMLVPLLPFYVKQLAGPGVDFLGLQLGVAEVNGIVVSSFTLAQLVSAPLWGRFSDRFGRRPALLIALGASALGYLIFGFADSIGMLLLSRIVQGAGGGTVGVIQAYVADATAPEQRARALGWLSAATNLGVALGPVLGSWAVAVGDVDLWPGTGTLQLGRSAPGVFAALLCLVTMALAAVWLRESNAERQPRNAPGRPRTREALLHVVSRIRQPSSRLILTYAIAIGAFQGINAVLALFLSARHGVTEKTIGYFYMYIGAIAVFTRVLLLGRLVDRFGEARLSRLGIVILATGVVRIPLSSSLPELALAVAMLPLGTAFTFPCVTAMLSRVVEQRDRGLYMGLQQTYGGLARIAAPLFYGWAFERLGLDTPFFFASAFVLATLPLGIGLHRHLAPRRDPPRTP